MCLFVWHHQHKICSQLVKACKNGCRTCFILHSKLIFVILGFALNWPFYLVPEDCASIYRGRWSSCCSDWLILKFPLLTSSNDVGAFKNEWFGDGKTAIFPNCLLLSCRKNSEIFKEVRVSSWTPSDPSDTFILFKKACKPWKVALKALRWNVLFFFDAHEVLL